MKEIEQRFAPDKLAWLNEQFSKSNTKPPEWTLPKQLRIVMLFEAAFIEN